ncbi:hypothetical protein MMC30_005206 [Trapelia coarctata]|nr:hypothetical protein [Trapelia coarctata]
MDVDYSLYLVTDSTKAVLGVRDLVHVVQQALEGGVTIVQYRDKTSETADLIRTAKKLHNLTKKHGVPLLINDRIDVALAIGAEGVHIGQDDMDLATARKILGLSAIIGVTCSSIDEAHAAAVGGADYLGIGTVFATSTKENTKSIIGTAGTRAILEHLGSIPTKERSDRLATVAIGGLNASNIQQLLFQSKSKSRGLDGFAVVSAIIAAQSPKSAAGELRNLIAKDLSFGASFPSGNADLSVKELVGKVPEVVRQLSNASPLCHNMTNLVVQNFAANVAVAIGASPIMANDGGEAEDLAKLGGALVINMGSATPESISNHLQALRAYNKCGGPVLFDPVGAGATELRRNAVKKLMSGGYFHVIKGNYSEIMTVSGSSGAQQKGVDSAKSDVSGVERACLVKTLASRERNVVIMTGEVDYLSDGVRTYSIANGHQYLGQITGSGCTLGTTIASFIAVERKDTLLAALAGVLMFEIAAERASRQPEVKGPGTFVPAFIDALSYIIIEAEAGKTAWIESAKVELVNA